MEENHQKNKKIEDNVSVTETELQENGWKKTDQYFADCQIWANGNNRLLYDLKLGKVFFCYSFN